LQSIGNGFLQTFQPSGIGPSTLDGTNSPVALSGDLHVVDKTSLFIQGEIENSGTITLQGSGALSLQPGSTATLSAGGSVVMSASGSGSIAGSGTLVNVDNEISGSGTFVANGGTLTLINQEAGSITASSGTLVLAAGVSVTNDGVIGTESSQLNI